MAMSRGADWPGGWRRLRDGLLASGRFQRLAAAFPPTRPIARRRAAALFGICSGFVHSQVLFACVRLEIFARLRASPLDAPTLAAQAAVPLRAMTSLLVAAAALRLLERRGDLYGLGPLGAAMLGNPAIAAMVEHHPALYADLLDPVALLRGETAERRLANYWPYAGSPAPATLSRDQVSPYTSLMAASQPMVADVVLAAYRFARHRCLLDVGGGDGSFLIAAGGRARRLALQLFDLPEVAAIARQNIAAGGLAHRTTVVGGSFLSDPLPRGADVISLIRVVHDHDDDTVLQLLARVREALPRGGTVVIGEPMSGAAASDSVAAYFAMYLLAMRSGRPRSFDDLQQLLRASGFSDVRQRATRLPLIAGVIVARA